MPYLNDEEKHLIDNGAPIKTSGQLNYAITQLLQEYVEENGFSYQTMNDVMGAAEGAKMEFYRRVVGVYEDNKARTNGDVYSDLVKRMLKHLLEKQ